MKNVLFIGPYRQLDGWGVASREYLRALNMTGNNIVARCIYPAIYLSTSYNGSEFEDLERKNISIDNCDIVIQHCLPHQFKKYGDIKNIGLSFFETSKLSSTPWIDNINIMDEMWVTSSFDRLNLLQAGVNIPIQTIYIPTDINKYSKQYHSFKLPKHHHEFKFYFIGEYIDRKDIESLIIAFHREFSADEPVRLILKLNRTGLDPHKLLNIVRNDIQRIKKKMRLYRDINYYKEDLIITHYLNNDELYSLHQECDCFVTASKGEAFCLPAFDALMFGKPAIINKNSGMSEYGSMVSTPMVNSYKTPVYTDHKPMESLYTSYDTWYQVDILDLQQKMRETYNLKNNITINDEIRHQYSYIAVAEQIKGVLQ